MLLSPEENGVGRHLGVPLHAPGRFADPEALHADRITGQGDGPGREGKRVGVPLKHLERPRTTGE